MNNSQNKSLQLIQDAIHHMIPLPPSHFDASSSNNTIPDTLCVNPISLHAFTQPSVMSSVLQSLQKCMLCNHRLWASNESIVNCISCGFHAHRSCAFRKRRCNNNNNNNNNMIYTMNKCNNSNVSDGIPVCEVNKKLILERIAFLKKIKLEDDLNHVTPSSHEDSNTINTSNFDIISEKSLLSIQNTSQYDETSQQPPVAISERNGFGLKFNLNPSTSITPIHDRSADIHSNHNGTINTTSVSHNSSDHNNNNNEDENDVNFTNNEKGNRNLDDLSSNDENEYNINLDQNDDDVVWSAEGPPTHWALTSPDALRGLRKISTTGDESATQIIKCNEISPNNTDTFTSQTMTNNNSVADDCDENNKKWDMSFSNFSKALQENVFAHFTFRKGDGEYDKVNEDTDENKVDNKVDTDDLIFNSSPTNVSLTDSTNDVDPKLVMNAMEHTLLPHGEDQTQISNTQQDTHHDNNEECLSKDEIKSMLKSAPAKPPSSPTSSQLAIQSAADTVRKSVSIASVAGGLAGGVAGLIIAGPAGAYVGSKLGQVAFVAGVILEGSVGVGILAAGVAGTVFTVNQLKGGERRMLTIGENGTERKVVLVRPNIVVDPEWKNITTVIRRNAPSDSSGGGALSFIGGNESGKKQRLKRDAEIVKADENEITMKEKVLLLVSSSLNDKTSLPGHVYRSLIKEHKDRALKRLTVDISNMDETKLHQFNRMTRDDTHAIIKYITATLLEVRPGFCSSPRMTEMSATAVETIVFGELYDCVYEEIVNETREKDHALMTQISQFQIDLTKKAFLSSPNDEKTIEISPHLDEYVSNDALNSLRMLPASHSVAEKLHYCVQFLESISNYFTSHNRKGAMGADCLLKMVCQHIIVAKVPNLNAEVMFLEEFARDEQLLRGKEGYALVTMQASLHFMNMSSNYEKDIFCEEND